MLPDTGCSLCYVVSLVKYLVLEIGLLELCFLVFPLPGYVITPRFGSSIYRYRSMCVGGR
jgi:hypothetical protein